MTYFRFLRNLNFKTFLSYRRGNKRNVSGTSYTLEYTTTPFGRVKYGNGTYSTFGDLKLIEDLLDQLFFT